MNQLVSILIPAYNSEQWIEDTVRSALEQSWTHKEIIIVDDGSTDSTYSILKQFASKNVKVFRQSNRGACAARNKALSYAQGEYIQWLDSDDLLDTNKISFQMKYAESGLDSMTLLTSTFGRFYYHWQCANFTPNSLWQDLEPKEWLIRKHRDNAWMNPATWLVSRKLTELTGPWNESLHRDQDGEYIVRVVCNSISVKFIEEAKSYYRIGRINSISMQNPYKVSLSYLQAGALSFKHIQEIYDCDLMRAACLKSLEHRMLDFYPDDPTLLNMAEKIAKGLGSEPIVPTLNWKYRFIKLIFGWRFVRHLKRFRLECRLFVSAFYEKYKFKDKYFSV